jgi:uncharacterized protein
MKTIRYRAPAEFIAVCLGPGEKLLESIRAAVKKHDIRNGVVVSGVATTRRCRMHYIRHTAFPPADTVYAVDAPLEIGSISGIIADGEPHLHIVAGHRDRRAWAGHLEDDTVIAYLAEICILKCNGMRMQRRRDPRYGVRLLSAAPRARRKRGRATR